MKGLRLRPVQPRTSPLPRMVRVAGCWQQLVRPWLRFSRAEAWKPSTSCWAPVGWLRRAARAGLLVGLTLAPELCSPPASSCGVTPHRRHLPPPGCRQLLLQRRNSLHKGQLVMPQHDASSHWRHPAISRRPLSYRVSVGISDVESVTKSHQRHKYPISRSAYSQNNHLPNLSPSNLCCRILAAVPRII